MPPHDLLDADDAGDTLRDDQPLRPARGYRIQFAEGDLHFRTLVVTDPVPLGRQILASAGADPRDGYALFAILPTGDFEEVRLDEPIDLHARGAEQFIAFRTDRTFAFTLNDRQLAWGAPSLPAAAVYQLAAPGDDEGVFLDVRGGTDRLVAPHETLDLAGGGVERFVTARKPPTEFNIVINGRHRTVTDPRVTFEQIVQLAFPDQPAEPNAVYSMTYRHAASAPHAGEVAAGGSVQVKNGTVFNVTKTIQS
ncbi:multiubiquitin domain-containing protein [Gemmatimonas sp.]